MEAVPTQRSMLEEHMKAAVFSLQSAYRSIEAAGHIAQRRNDEELDNILGGMSIELRDMLAGADGEIGLAKATQLIEFTLE